MERMRQIPRQLKAVAYHEVAKRTIPGYRDSLRGSRESILSSALDGRSHEEREGKMFLATVGFSKAGKSTVASELEARLPHLVRIETDAIHDVINSKFPQLADDNTVAGKGFWLRQVITRQLRKEVLEDICSEGWWVINDSANLTRSERDSRLRVPKDHNYKTALIWLQVPEDVLFERLQAADAGNVARGEAPTWVDLYQRVQKPSFEEPQEGESDSLFMVENPQREISDLVTKVSLLAHQ